MFLRRWSTARNLVSDCASVTVITRSSKPFNASPLFMFQKCALLEFAECQPEFGLRIHDDWTIPGDWLLQRLPRHQQESDPVLTPSDNNLVSSIEQYERAVVDLGRRCRMRPPANAFGWHRERFRRVAERARSVEHISECVARGFDR